MGQRLTGCTPLYQSAESGRLGESDWQCLPGQHVAW
jgi:hypothetical protein